MTKTAYTARGTKVRTSSTRRYLLVAEYIDRETGNTTEHRIEKRSDNRAMLETILRRTGAYNGYSGYVTFRSIVDTAPPLS